MWRGVGKGRGGCRDFFFVFVCLFRFFCFVSDVKGGRGIFKVLRVVGFRRGFFIKI